MADWDEDNEKLSNNLKRILHGLHKEGRRRAMPKVNDARTWQRDIMDGLVSPKLHYVGRFRGERSLEDCGVRIGRHLGTHPDDVAEELKAFEEKLQQVIAALDQIIPPNKELTADDLADVIDLCAWAHSEWVRIHPFVNGNGRTARLWANSLAMRYGLPPFVRLRPRPDGGYGEAAGAAMRGNWQETVPVFQRMYMEAIGY